MTKNKKIREISHDEWKKEGESLFGKDRTKWKFICPACWYVTTVQDWIDLGGRDMVAFSCVGRLMEKCRDAFGKGPGPCNYAGGGLFPLNPVKVVYPNGKSERVFDFAREEAIK